MREDEMLATFHDMLRFLRGEEASEEVGESIFCGVKVKNINNGDESRKQAAILRLQKNIQRIEKIKELGKTLEAIDKRILALVSGEEVQLVEVKTEVGSRKHLPVSLKDLQSMRADIAREIALLRAAKVPRDAGF